MQLETEGLHPATEICLEGLQWLHEHYPLSPRERVGVREPAIINTLTLPSPEGRGFNNILDMGCGGGILSLVCANIWDAQVLAVDIAEKAVDETNELIRREGLEHSITALRSDGFLAPDIAARAPFDLIIINLLAEPIVSWAALVKKHLAPGGTAIFGGILDWQAPTVTQAYEGLGFEIQHEISASPWRLMIFTAASPHP